ncbi:MAG: 6-phosphogluconolactonase, partial [Anaerolineae bacterium]|nr:6-phosphogluconolactonase [Anaerolineae bacterium]
MSTVKTYPDAAALADAAARMIVERAAQAIALRERFCIALSGGSTPHATYARLAAPDLAKEVDWQRFHVFWGDERAVPPDNVESNYRMTHEAWLAHVPIPEENVHRIRGEMPPEAAAAEYEGELRSFFASQARLSGPLVARFDLILLGMGGDGHTASLFPGSAVIHEARRWVDAYRVEKLNMWRITVTPVVINAAAQVAFLVSGAK